MARNEAWTPATPERVFEILSDPAYYGYWVAGSREIRGADPGFPGLGTKFHHTVGFWPLKSKDHTRVEAVRPPHHIKLRAKARPFGTACVTLDLRQERGGTHITMIEDPGDKFTALLFNPAMHMLVRMRNERSLKKLCELAEGRGPSRQKAAHAASA